MTSYALGIDCGNTAIKAALFDSHGSEIDTVAINFPTHIPKPEHTEADMNECWQLCADVIKRLVERTNVDSLRIKAIGVSGHGNGLYLLDEKRSPLLAIKSLDNRATCEVQALESSDGYLDLKRRNRQGVWSSQSAVLLMWLKRNSPQTYERIGQVLFCKDYINYQLTGECVTEWSDLTASGLFDFEQDKVSEALLRHYDLTDIQHKLPAIVEGSQIIGGITDAASKLTGLAVGTPVIAGLFDVVAGAYGSEATNLGDVSIVAGTWNINQVVTDSLPSEKVFMACKLSRQSYLAIESSTCSASNLEWLVQRFFSAEREIETKLGGSIFERFNRKLEDVEQQEALPVFLPYLYGSTDRTATAANLFGLKSWHEDIHIVYAFYEGIVFAHLEHVQRLREAGYKVETISISGGASRSDYWCQLFADVLDVKVIAMNCKEVGAKGVAMLAWEAVTRETDTEQGLCVNKRIFNPIGERRVYYSQRFQKYCAVRDALNTI
ncbi:FGGY-family carbohydrate kinase [Vibrio mytili]|uniref:FGGY-family carbohydrate kinase n=1 Tax=Vibrio mytili TaxID=50718 RepID=UPI002F42ACF8